MTPVVNSEMNEIISLLTNKNFTITNSTEGNKFYHYLPYHVIDFLNMDYYLTINIIYTDTKINKYELFSSKKNLDELYTYQTLNHFKKTLQIEMWELFRKEKIEKLLKD